MPIEKAADDLSPPRRVIICDLDNCLVDDSHRLRFIDWGRSVAEGRYDAYHAMCVFDPPPNEELMEKLVATEHAWRADIVFLTARPAKFRDSTLAYLRAHGLSRAMLMMRGDTDHRSSLELKREMLAHLLNPNNVGYEQVIAAYDDRQDIVDMYTAAGINAQRVAIHDQCAYTPPPSQPPAIDFAAAPAVRAPDHLERGAATFRERNAIYGDTYLLFGEAMRAAFPNGVHIEADDVEGMNRLGIYVQCLGKLLRYGPNLAKGGHADSAHDLMVYGAMLQEVTK